MKQLSNIFFGVSIFAIAISFSACEEEVHPELNFEILLGESSIEEVESKQEKVILLEEFTGVRCPNCPAGSDFAEELSNQNPGRLQIISIHSGAFAIPFPDGEGGFEPNLKTEVGGQIETLLGSTIAYPSASINRQSFDDSEIIQTSLSDWSNSFQTLVSEKTNVNVNITNNFSKTDTTGNVFVNIHFTEEVSEITKLSIYLIESDIKLTQDVDGFKDKEYKHKHVLRKSIAGAGGTIISQNAAAGYTIDATGALKDFDPIWNLDNIEIVAFVHLSGNNLDVLQVAHQKLTD